MAPRKAAVEPLLHHQYQAVAPAVSLAAASPGRYIWGGLHTQHAPVKAGACVEQQSFHR
jgi:hypothetical protein